MGRNAQKKSAAFTKVVENRESLIVKINNCKSLTSLEQLKSEYKDQPKYSLSSKAYKGKGISLEKLQTLTNLDARIKKAFTDQEKALTPVVIKPVEELSSSLANEDLAENNVVEPEFIIDELVLDEPREAVIEPRVSELERTQRKKEIAHIEDELLNVYKKCRRMSTQGPAYKDVTEATYRIHEAITALAEKYVEDGDLEHFKGQTKALLDENTEDMKIINKHRGWAKNFFGNLGAFILGLGVGYIAVCAYRGTLFEFNTATANAVGAVDEKVSSLKVR